MNNPINLFAAALCMCGAGSSAHPSFVQGQPAVPERPVVMGTRQLPGEFGKLGTTYTIGKEKPLNFTLISAEYRADRFVGGTLEEERTSWVPDVEHKLLVLKYSVQNPNPVETRLWYNTFDLTAVSSDDQNSKLINLPWIGSNSKYVEVQLKPGQKVFLSGAILVSAVGETPKLIVAKTYDDTASVVRYDLRGKVAKIPATFSEDGITALPAVNVTFGRPLPCFGCDVKFLDFSHTSDPIAYEGFDASQDHWTLRLSARAVTPAKNRLWYGTFKVSIKSADGDVVTVNTYQSLLRAARDEPFDGQCPLDDDLTLRLILAVSKGVKPAVVKVSFDEPDHAGRTYLLSVPAQPRAYPAIQKPSFRR